MEEFFFFAGAFAVALVAVVFASFVIKHLWMFFSYRVLGIKPLIHDERLVDETAGMAARVYVEGTVRNALKQNGTVHSQEELDAHFALMKAYSRLVVLQYIQSFARSQ